jgi:hypothetical protein
MDVPFMEDKALWTCHCKKTNYFHSLTFSYAATKLLQGDNVFLFHKLEVYKGMFDAVYNPVSSSVPRLVCVLAII